MDRIEKIDIPGVIIFNPNVFKDIRGEFIKIYNEENFRKLGILDVFKEEYYSISKPNVLRGMHFQTPPHDHGKLVTCIKGKVVDIVVDIRKESKTYGEYVSIDLSEDNRKSIYIPKGCAHGFYVDGKEDAIMLYNVSTVFSSEHDSGIHYTSFNIPWNLKKKPIISAKDNNLPKIENFYNPF